MAMNDLKEQAWRPPLSTPQTPTHAVTPSPQGGPWRGATGQAPQRGVCGPVPAGKRLVMVPVRDTEVGTQLVSAPLPREPLPSFPA